MQGERPVTDRSVPLVVLYARKDAFGDGLLRIPALRAARTAFPDSRIVYGAGGGSSLESVLRRHVDHLVDDFRTETPLIDIIREMRPRRRPAAIVDFRNVVPWLLATRFGLVGRRIRYEANFPGFLLSAPLWTIPGARPEHNAWRYHRMVERTAGSSLPFDHTLSVPEAARARARDIVGMFDRPLVLISANSGPRKRLTDQQAAMVAKKLIDEGSRVIYLQSPGKGPTMEALEPLEPRLTVVGPSPELAPEELQDLFLALGEVAAAFIGAEGGMTHFLSTVMTPTVVLNPGSNIRRWRPLSGMVEVVEAGDGSNENKDPAAILAAVHRLIQAGRRDHPDYLSRSAPLSMHSGAR